MDFKDLDLPAATNYFSVSIGIASCTPEETFSRKRVGILISISHVLLTATLFVLCSLFRSRLGCVPRCWSPCG